MWRGRRGDRHGRVRRRAAAAPLSAAAIGGSPFHPGGLMPSAADLAATDRQRVIHPLHHPSDAAQTTIFVRGRGAMLEAADGVEYLDGLSGLWNVNAGHGRVELADAAAAQMKELAYCSGFVGSSNLPSIALAARLVELTGQTMEAVFFTSGGAEANESAFKTARFYWKARGRPGKVKIIAREQ